MEPTGDKKPVSKPRAKVIVNYAWCKKCHICIGLCPSKVFTSDEFGAPIISSPEKCTNCGLCVLRCPEFTIKLEPLTDGQPAQEEARGGSDAGAQSKKGASQ
jgi:2-oxoglutarate ferredoxin oxidoreductase subunit delta